MSPAVSLKGLSLHGFSVLCPLGDHCEQVYRAVTSGLSAYEASDRTGSRGRSLTVASVPAPALATLKDKPFSERQSRMLGLALPALASLHQTLAWKKPLPLILAVPEKRPEARTPFDDKMLQELMTQTELDWDLANSYTLPLGRCGGLSALVTAKTLLDEGLAKAVVIGAVDSQLDSESLSHLDYHGRLVAEGVRDGSCPSEAACFTVVSKHPVQQSLQLQAIAETQEPGHFYSDAPFTAEGLARAAMAVLEPFSGVNEVSKLLGTLNGENFYAKEWGILEVRANEFLTPGYGSIQSAESLGDVGAAAGLVNLMLCHEASRLGELKGRALICAASELSPRSALLVRAQADVQS